MCPRMKVVAIAGTSVTDRIAANAIEKVFVQARGEKRRPSVPSSVKTGRKPTVMTSREKKIGRPTSCNAATTTSVRGSFWPEGTAYRGGGGRVAGGRAANLLLPARHHGEIGRAHV